MTATLDLEDPTLRAQYEQLAQRIARELSATTKTCAALISVEHQPHVSDVALRTAMLLCGGGKHVLLVDAALGDKQLTSGLNLTMEFGLSEVLKGRVPWQQAVRATATAGLCVLPAGRLVPPRLAEDDERLSDLLKELTSQWDFVLLDGGSLAESSARYAAAAARNVYLVVRLGETDADAAQEAAKSLAAPEFAFRGCVVTNAA
jgi:tyrosine-protein kinase Etk/Wzc